MRYAIYFTILAFRDDRFKNIVIDNSTNNKELFTNSLIYILYLLIYIFLLIAIFSLPIFFTLKIKNAGYFLIMYFIILLLEYRFYTWSSSLTDTVDGMYFCIVSIISFVVYFFEEIKFKFNGYI
jgi:hypothetical protein